MLDYSLLPAHMQDGMRRYIEQRIPPGSFMEAVLANDFVAAVGKADAINSHRLNDYAMFLYNELPGRGYPNSPWGSYDAVRNWLNPKLEESNDNADDN